MSISVSGLISGVDYESMITKLVAVESQPLTALQTKEASYQAKITGYGTLKSALAEFQTAMSSLSKASAFQNVTASSTDTDVATVTASTSAKAGTYSLEVSKLAQAQKLVATGQASETASIGTGTITFDFGKVTGTLNSTTGKYQSGATFVSSGSGVKTVTIDSSNNSLSGIRDAINDADIGVTATIVNDGSGTPYRLALTVANAGEENSLKISVDDSGGALSTLLGNDPAGTQNLTQTQAAQNAEFEVDGIAVSKASNTVTDVISGLTLNLLATSTSASSITVTRDTAAVTTNVNSFVKAYNTIVQTLSDSTAYNADTKTAAILNGESSVRAIQTQLSSILTTPLTGGSSGLSMLSAAGVSLQKDGTLSVDSSKLQKALASNYDDFASLFAANGQTTDSMVAFSTSTSSTQAGSYAITVSQMATQGSILASAAPTTLKIETGVNDTLDVQLDGMSATITLDAGTYASADALATAIQSKINGVAAFVSAKSTATVSVSNGALKITSDRYGSASNASLVGGNGQDNLNLGSSATVTAGVDVVGTINGLAATGSGQTLTSSMGDSQGIAVTISGGSTGDRGTINFSQGYAYQLNTLVTTLLDDDGPIATRIEGLNKTIDDIGDQEDVINTHLKVYETRYRAQFTALETLLATLSTTSSFLTQQITALADLRKQSSS
ncbi:MAG: flagellar filament capping protein FliD [Burkholderiaceae bacterium]|nr:flagellar filament capping protein FliD [Burkholderiaceae bacterium]